MKFVIVLTVALLAVVFAEEPIPIVRSESNINPDGSYEYAYETGNGISAAEQGQVKNAGTDEESIGVQGQFSYKNDDGSTVSLQYIADENGFQPQGDHIPVAPPIPEYIQRALKYVAEHPPARESK